MPEQELTLLKREIACLQLSLQLHQEHCSPAWRWSCPKWQEGPLYGLGWPEWKPSWRGKLLQVTVMSILLLLYLPLTVLYLLFEAFWPVVDLWGHYRRYNQRINVLNDKIVTHTAPWCSLWALWAHYAPDGRLIGRTERHHLLVHWMTILYGGSAEHWSNEIARLSQDIIDATIRSHIANLEDENTPRFFYGDPIEATERTLDRELGSYRIT